MRSWQEIINEYCPNIKGDEVNALWVQRDVHEMIWKIKKTMHPEKQEDCIRWYLKQFLMTSTQDYEVSGLIDYVKDYYPEYLDIVNKVILLK